MKRAILQILALLPIPILVGVLFHHTLQPHHNGLSEKKVEKKIEKKKEKNPALLPDDLGSGWRVTSPIEKFDDKTIFDRIDGAAPAFLNRGFVFSLGGEFKKEGRGEAVIFDVYDMATPEQAKAMYLSESDPSYQQMAMGDGGYYASGALNFWQGRFYIKLAGSDDNEQTAQDMKELAALIVKALDKKSTEKK